ncbi:MAG: hypothetical protein Q4A16_02440 [Lautropia sp.]|nr:hypothetical protein [Lautropia sp.]
MRPTYYEDITPLDSEREASFRQTALLDYCLHIAGMILSVGTLSLVALIINYIQRPSARGTLYESHFTWMIRTCWWTIAWLVILGVPVLITFGVLSFILFIPCIWYLYRMIKGLIYLKDRKPMPIY